ncbi:Uncharacterised protein [uncultured Clostridium sp.]|uniref:hypothetical protein n=1 Tax=uncultured Clostridium sp. TaxID=59620 RepID=UPI0008206A42|nr:hypothetical protein [uncultured Clostridium sp.]SCK01864.1 Uncharacterised protein [uncultured Clostridium sp.]
MDKVKEVFKVTKKTLLFIAGLVWSFAGFRVFTIGLEDVINYRGNVFISMLVSAVVFYIFFKFIFSKMHKKHFIRITTSYLDKQYFFKFFDLKSYLIMGFMITFGILVRASGIFNPIGIANFYIGLGFALFLSGVLFFISFFKYKEDKGIIGELES